MNNREYHHVLPLLSLLAKDNPVEFREGLLEIIKDTLRNDEFYASSYGITIDQLRGLAPYPPERTKEEWEEFKAYMDSLPCGLQDAHFDKDEAIREIIALWREWERGKQDVPFGAFVTENAKL